MLRKVCTRKVDELGRIVLPVEAREALGITEKQSMDVFIDGKSILLKPNNDIPSCKLCGQEGVELIEVGTSLICVDCVGKVCLANIKGR